MQSMPRPFSSLHCHDQHLANARSFSVDMHHSFANSSLGPPDVRLGNTVLYHPEYSNTAPSTVSYTPSTNSRYPRNNRKRIKTCCCIFGSHVATIIFTLFLVAVVLLVVQISTRQGLGLLPGEKSTKEMPRSDWDVKTVFKASEPRQWMGESSSASILPTTRIIKDQAYNDLHNESDLKNEVENAKTKRKVLDFEKTTRQSTNTIVTIPEEQLNDASLYLTRKTSPLLTTTTTTTTTTPSVKTVGVSRGNTDVTRNIMENDEQICCKKLNLTSTGETKELYPFVIGVYHLTNDSRAIYAKEGQRRFISRPPGLTRRGMNTFSWGINSNPDGKWGWIKAFSNADCPDMIDHWKAYDRIKKTW